jgi:23S rRNA (uracil1939-C5)-methyltransferase
MRILVTGGAGFIGSHVVDAYIAAGHQVAILDPPRAGCEPAAIGELIRLGVDRLVYVSCEPSTHARDLIALVRGGYRVRRAAIVDMFPQTYHIESVALLQRG